MHRTFISYAHNQPDCETARRLYTGLDAAGHNPWLDEVDLKGGVYWQPTIVDQIKKCKHFIALLSSHSLNKRGFVQKELRTALAVLDTTPVDSRFLIPVRLDPCTPRDEGLAQLQWVDLFPDYDVGLAKLLKALDDGRQIPGRLWIDVGVEMPKDIANWPDERLFPYIEEVLLPEARERAHRDFESIQMRDPDAAIRERVTEKLVEVANRCGFRKGLNRFLGLEEKKGNPPNKPV